MFKKVLVANRGEVAVRIIRTLKEMGIQTVAIYSTADQNALHVQIADEAICVGGPKPQDSYINMKNVISAAVLTGSEAIHPGYGFLSENDLFAEMVGDVGIKWIGPRPETIDLMGNKEHARNEMRKADVPVIPGSLGYIHTVDEAREVADEIGYPVLLKAAAGGGGKGMRFIYKPEELKENFENAQAEAEINYGDHHMYIEKVMLDCRHIEMQVIRDQFGNVVCFPERNCSLQRRNQKVMEESPASSMTPENRADMIDVVTKAVNAIDYENTGTIEFLQDQEGNFYFMEMNTRIQVEHPVTEMVTGLDLVRLQVLVAAGEKLPLTQADVQIKGHAIEMRLTAERSDANFAPSAGKVDFVFLPTGGPGVRIDSALYSGDMIQPFYDSMIAKLIAHDDTREEAIAKLSRMIEETTVSGVSTSQDFQLEILKDQGVLNDEVTTKYLENVFMPKWEAAQAEKEEAAE
ncbi:acetyl-CoA carboxylase biotin carboxylase subunit [Fructobacillus papyrifericola]|uniref:biotin carboxylase n=1 Tax=Fructobacillus papyrifericola TaxID=2713172 RepID=A0ABS5QTI6_9LACO|nr:acetyl-CoA carboxylase biotin carboxylase subunit [Fructobacillus papyrifericola]MBS9336520.1 acetyl-CoA carboxylase biotin carboxylase subunit [Fructobacillus papyrifericola]